MVREEDLEVINKVVNRLSPSHVFPNYSIEDIKQEAYIMCLQALPKWDGVRPLENFLARHVRNRLNNLKRDKYYRPGCEIQKEKKKLLEANGGELQNLILTSSGSDILENRELIDYIKERLTAREHPQFLRFLSNGRGPHKLMNRLKKIVGDFYGEL